MKTAILDEEYSATAPLKIKASRLPAIVVISVSFRRLFNRVLKKGITNTIG